MEASQRRISSELTLDEYREAPVAPADDAPDAPFRLSGSRQTRDTDMGCVTQSGADVPLVAVMTPAAQGSLDVARSDGGYAGDGGPPLAASPSGIFWPMHSRAARGGIAANPGETASRPVRAGPRTTESVSAGTLPAAVASARGGGEASVAEPRTSAGVHGSRGEDGEIAEPGAGATVARRSDDVRTTVQMLGRIGRDGSLARITSVAVMKVDLGQPGGSRRPQPIEIPIELAPDIAQSPWMRSLASSPRRDNQNWDLGGGVAATPTSGFHPRQSSASANSTSRALRAPANALERMRGIRRDVESTLEAVYHGWEQAAAASIATSRRTAAQAARGTAPGVARRSTRMPDVGGMEPFPSETPEIGSPDRAPPHEHTFAPPKMTDAAIAVERARAEDVLSKSLQSLRRECVAREWYAAAFEVDARARIAPDIVAVALASAATRSLSSAHAQLSAALRWMVGPRVVTAVRVVDAAVASARTLMGVLRQVCASYAHHAVRCCCPSLSVVHTRRIHGIRRVDALRPRRRTLTEQPLLPCLLVTSLRRCGRRPRLRQLPVQSGATGNVEICPLPSPRFAPLLPRAESLKAWSHHRGGGSGAAASASGSTARCRR